MLPPTCFFDCSLQNQDKSSTSNLKIEALIFTRLVLSSHSPSVFHRYIKLEKMPPQGKKWVKPGHTSRMLSEYKKQRQNTIANNQMIMYSMGLHSAAKSFMHVFESGKKGNNNMRGEDDEEYISHVGEEESTGDDGGDDNNEYSAPQMEKVHMAPTSRPSRHSSTHTQGAALAQDGYDTQLNVSHPIHSVSSSAASTSKKRVRGPTTGLNTEKDVRQPGRLYVEVPASDGAPVGINAPALGQQTGIEVRNGALLQEIT